MQLTGYMQGQRKRKLLDDNEVFGLGIWKAGGSSYHSWEHWREADWEPGETTSICFGHAKFYGRICYIITVSNVCVCF